MYSKLYRSIFDGTLYGKFEALTVFMALLALADWHGEVDASPERIAGSLGCGVDFVLRGIEQLKEPDPYSRTPAEEGRRIAPLLNDEGQPRPFGWRIVNYVKYRSIRNEEARREYQREWVKGKRRQNVSTGVDSRQVSTGVDRGLAHSTHTDTDTDKTKKYLPPCGGFDRFWNAWPRHSRKQAKGKCLDLWRRGNFEAAAAQIVSHVEALKASPDWRKDAGAFIPAPLVYLSQRRWEGADLGTCGANVLKVAL